MSIVGLCMETIRFINEKQGAGRFDRLRESLSQITTCAKKTPKTMPKKTPQNIYKIPKDFPAILLTNYIDPSLKYLYKYYKFSGFFDPKTRKLALEDEAKIFGIDIKGITIVENLKLKN